MTLIKSISGIRGTIGGSQGDNLTPADIVSFTAAYATWLKSQGRGLNLRVVTGRDARTTGEMVGGIVTSTLTAMGVDVIELGLSTTPTVEMMVAFEKADGGIIITASHNTAEWNALKLLNHRGEFISSSDGEEIVRLAEAGNFSYAAAPEIGMRSMAVDSMEKHIAAVLKMKGVDRKKIAERKLKVAVDAVNSSGGIFIPGLLRKLGVEDIIEVNCQPTGVFAHNPEPLKENLGDLCAAVLKHKADLGIAVDPDVDRLVFVCEDGELFGEEYTLVAVADYVLSSVKGNTVSNLSSTRALDDITRSHGGKYFAAAVGEVNVVEKMKEVKAVIGGEGNGGIICPDLHYGRDALAGTALFLSHLCTWNGGKKTASELRKSYPSYYMSKQKISLPAGTELQKVLDKMAGQYAKERLDITDGLKVDFEREWVHLRKSNTEPIIRIYAESTSQEMADKLAGRVKGEIGKLI